MKKRLDLILFEHGFFETKAKAQSAILSGDVKIDDRVVTKAGELYSEEKLFDEKNPSNIVVKTMPYVSRGGFKLACALDSFNIDLNDKICIDMGASTGGFTDCMLQRGAKKVYALDVGYNQLSWKLKQDERVVSVEKINIKTAKPQDVFLDMKEENLPDFMSMDLSFISIKKVLNNTLNFIKKDAQMVLLIKPQFEAQRENIEKGGVVRDENVHKKIIEDIKDHSFSLGLNFGGVVKSPIQGAKQGNVEYLIYLTR